MALQLVKVYQYVETRESDESARECMSVLNIQDNFIAGRILEPSPAKPGWRVQAFFDADDGTTGWIPDGLRRTWCPTDLIDSCEFQAQWETGR